MQNQTDISISTETLVSGQLGIVTLQRPRQLNALTANMIRSIHAQLRDWEQDASIMAVLLLGEGEQAFCAGGDIRALYQAMRDKYPADEFFRDEYRLNYYIAQYRKPYIAWMDGITMGGGAGIAIHGNTRIATEKTVFAMPETGIGFFPDIGASYFLSRLPHHIGRYLGLTGQRIRAEDLFYLGLADGVLASKQFDDLLTFIRQSDLSHNPQQQIHRYLKQQSQPGESLLAQHADVIETCFSKPSVDAIIKSLSQHDSDWATQTLSTLASKSPTSLKVTFKLLDQAAAMDLSACLKMEYRCASQFLQCGDFIEGIRAVLIDKDHQPNWQPRQLHEVSDELVNQFFTAPHSELDF